MPDAPPRPGGRTVGVDVGGTFTDVVLAGPRGQEAVAKRLSTPDDPAAAVVDGVRAVLAEARVRPADVVRVVHATTLATNLVLEGRGGRVAFVTTRGFADLLTLGRHARVEEDRYDLRSDPPEPPVAAADCFTVTERVDASGAVVVPLDEADAARAADEIARRGITAAAVCLLHAYAEPAHERRVAACRVGADAGRPDLVSFDMGGTTAKACVVRDGRPDITREFHVGGKGSFGGRRAGTGTPIRIPAIDLAEVGAGGGSIARVDAAGSLHVGPRSAGADPGPACYGRGGTEPTVTDADLLLGYLDPDAFARGAFALRADLARTAVHERIAGPLGLGADEAAHAVHELANAVMGSAVHVVTVQRGIDPRGYALVALGGAGPVHGARVAERFGIGTVLVPPSCGIGSAVGLPAADLRTARARTPARRGLPDADVEALYADLARDALTDLGADPADPAVAVERTAAVRYVGQGHDLAAPVGGGPFAVTAVARDFRERYRAAFGIAPDDPVEIVGAGVRVTRRIPRAPLGVRPDAGGDSLLGARPAWFPETGGAVPTPVHDRHRCRPGDRFDGPAIVQDGESTALVPPGWTARIDERHNLVLEAR